MDGSNGTFVDEQSVSAKIQELILFIRRKCLIKIFRDECDFADGCFTSLLHFAEKHFGGDFVEDLFNVYDTRNPFLKMLKRTHQKAISLATFLMEIKIYAIDDSGNVVRYPDGKVELQPLTGVVKIRSALKGGSLRIEIQNRKRVVTMTEHNFPPSIHKIVVDKGIIQSVTDMLTALQVSEVEVNMNDIVGIGGQGIVLGRNLFFDVPLDACIKFIPYQDSQRLKVEEIAREYECVMVDGAWLPTGKVYGRGFMKHLNESTEFYLGTKINHRNVISILDAAITKTIFGDWFLVIGNLLERWYLDNF